ncbi:hypothetical protein H4W33_002381 [Kibdelosporangium phytohabitans]|nr:hypothetical protein [Kibdelosporangium phytohabitans]
MAVFAGAPLLAAALVAVTWRRADARRSAGQ